MTTMHDIACYSQNGYHSCYVIFPGLEDLGLLIAITKTAMVQASRTAALKQTRTHPNRRRQKIKLVGRGR